jgi:Na+/H+-dicarboxylate symporter/ABC-type amino acid transport substrate-binding protein
MTFSRKILAGLGAGIVVGLFFGEKVAPLAVVADGFVKLLQMTVLPYVTVSIITSLGTIDLSQAKSLGFKAGAVLAGLWGIALFFCFLFPLVFPSAETASFFSVSLVQKPPPFDFVGLYIPSNPFNSLANNIVPAVVLFSVLLGVALIGIERKKVLLDVLGVASATIARATRFIVQLTPYGIFALAATAAGTLHLEQVERIQLYLITYIAISLLVSLWVLPGIVAALTPIPYREVLGPTRDALITAFIAGDLFIVLPSLIESCKELLTKYSPASARSSDLPDVLVPASFNFPHTGKLLSLSFILFAGWFAGAPVPMTKYPQLALTGLLTFFGSLNAAVPFLLDLFRIPADTFQLFVATGVINARFGTLTAAVHTVVVALLCSAAVAGTMRFDPQRVIRYLVITGVLTGLTIGGLRVMFRTLLLQEFKGADIVYGMTNLLEHDPTRVVPQFTPEEPGRPVRESIRARGTLRVCFALPRLPFVFRNGRGDLVGFDIELAHLLARDLGVKVEFAEWPSGELVRAVTAGQCDMGIGGTPVTPSLATQTLFSEPYIDETLAFVVKDHLRSRFETWASIEEIRDITIGVPPLPYYEQALKARLPGVRMREYDLTQDPLSDSEGFDAIAMPAERGSVMTLLNPRWTVVVPQPDLIKIPLAFPLASGDLAWASFINGWIELKRRDGSLDGLYSHWILGSVPGTRTAPRWSVIRNVLHWVE